MSNELHLFVRTLRHHLFLILSVRLVELLLYSIFILLHKKCAQESEGESKIFMGVVMDSSNFPGILVTTFLPFAPIPQLSSSYESFSSPSLAIGDIGLITLR